MKKRRLSVFLAAIGLLLFPMLVSAAVLWEQTISANTEAYYSQNYEVASSDYDCAVADDFTNLVAWEISTIYIPGAFWDGGTSLITTTAALTWVIYEDNGGVPSGNPYAADPNQWSLTLLPGNYSQVVFDGPNVTLNLDTPIQLPAGTWWLAFYPTMDYNLYRGWGRRGSGTTNGYDGQVIVPNGATVGWGAAVNWTSVQTPLPWDAGTTDQDIAFRIEGIAVPQNISVNPTSWNFGSVLVATTSTKTFAISNNGGEDLEITDIAISGSTKYSLNVNPVTDPCGTTITLTSGNSCNVEVTFAPDNLVAQTGSLDITSNDPGTAVFQAPLTGIGTATAVPNIVVTPASINFGSVPVDETVVRTLTISNTGTADLVINNVAITGTAFEVGAGTCLSLTPTIVPTSACTLDITFTATTLGANSGVLGISSNDPDIATVAVALLGTGTGGNQGTIGTQYTITGSGFGTKKGKVYVGGLKQKVEVWSDTSITVIFTKYKGLVTGTPLDVSIQWKPKGSKTTNIIDLPGAFTLRKPEINPVNTGSGSAGDLITINGMWFGTKKGKVYVHDQKCKVKSWTMDPTTGVSSLVFEVSSKIGAGKYGLEVENKIGRSVSFGFEVK